MTPALKETLIYGRIGERAVDHWLRKRGHVITAIYDKEVPDDACKGPRVYARDEELISPDILSLRHGIATWIEIKTKYAFSWFYTKRQWQAGINLQSYLDYLRIKQLTQLRVYVCFLVLSAKPWSYDIPTGCPSIAPNGLFGAEISDLHQGEDHRSDLHDPKGMVYWNLSMLHPLATIKEVHGD